MHSLSCLAYSLSDNLLGPAGLYNVLISALNRKSYLKLEDFVRIVCRVLHTWRIRSILFISIARLLKEFKYENVTLEENICFENYFSTCPSPQETTFNYEAGTERLYFKHDISIRQGKYGREVVSVSRERIKRGEKMIAEKPFVMVRGISCNCNDNINVSLKHHPFLIEHINMAILLFQSRPEMNPSTQNNKDFTYFMNSLQPHLPNDIIQNFKNKDHHNNHNNNHNSYQIHDWPFQSICFMTVVCVVYQLISLHHSKIIINGLLTQSKKSQNIITVTDTFQNECKSIEEEDILMEILYQQSWRMLLILSRIPTNTHAITSIQSIPESYPYRKDYPSNNIINLKEVRIGYGLFLYTSAINHSCEPNAIVRFSFSNTHQSAKPSQQEQQQQQTNTFEYKGNISDGLIDFCSVCVEVIATKIIDPLEEVRISYGPIKGGGFTILERRRLLQHQYFFCCECPGCLSELLLTNDSSGLGSVVDTSLVQEGGHGSGDLDGPICPLLGTVEDSNVRGTSYGVNGNEREEEGMERNSANTTEVNAREWISTYLDTTNINFWNAEGVSFLQHQQQHQLQQQSVSVLDSEDGLVKQLHQLQQRFQLGKEQLLKEIEVLGTADTHKIGVVKVSYNSTFLSILSAINTLKQSFPPPTTTASSSSVSTCTVTSDARTAADNTHGRNRDGATVVVTPCNNLASSHSSDTIISFRSRFLRLLVRLEWDVLDFCAKLFAENHLYFEASILIQMSITVLITSGRYDRRDILIGREFVKLALLLYHHKKYELCKRVIHEQCLPILNDNVSADDNDYVICIDILNSSQIKGLYVDRV